MRHITISTTGIFNAIRPSLFPPIEGKKTTTFLLGLDFHMGEISPFYDEEQDDVVVNGPHIELERQRIRAFVKAVCEEMGKPFEECRSAFLFSLPEFIRYGTYNGQPLLEKPRTGEYEVYVLYKSHRGRKLLFQKGRPPKDEVQYVFDNMLRHFITTLFSDEGTYGHLSDVKHIETPLSLGVLQQSLEDIKAADEDIFSEGIDAFSVPNHYVMTEPTQVHSEFLLLADALGAYMVQAMDGETESDALKTLSRDRLLQNICESMYKMYMGPSEEAAIGVYDECERWLNPFIRQCWNIQYTMVRRTLKQVPTYDDGVLGYVKEQQVFPLVAHIIREISTENLGVELHPKVHQYKQYLDVLVPYVDRVEELYRKRYVGVGDDPFGMNKADDMPPVDVELCCHVYCALACAFDLKYLQLALLHFYVETDNRVGYERYIETVYPQLFSMRFDWISQMHVLLNENGHEAEDEYTEGNHYWNYTNAVFLLWVKAVWHFHLDHMDQASWDELGTLWDATYDNPNY